MAKVIKGRFVKGQSGNPGGRPKNGGKRKGVDKARVDKVLGMLIDVALEGGKDYLRTMRDDDAKAFSNLILQLHKVQESRLPPPPPEDDIMPAEEAARILGLLEFRESPAWEWTMEGGTKSRVPKRDGRGWRLERWPTEYESGLCDALKDWIEHGDNARPRRGRFMNKYPERDFDHKDYLEGYSDGAKWCRSPERRIAAAEALAPAWDRPDTRPEERQALPGGNKALPEPRQQALPGTAGWAMNLATTEVSNDD